MIIRFAAFFVGAIFIYGIYESGIKTWDSWAVLAISILFVSHALNPKWSNRILTYFMNTVFNAKLEPIDQACANGNMKMVSGYLQAKGDPNITNENELTLLDIAIENNHGEIADLLRKHGGKTGEELKAEGRKRDFTKPLSHGNCVRLIEKRERQWNLHCLIPFFIGVLSV